MNSLFGISPKLCLENDIIYNNSILAILWHVVFATLGDLDTHLQGPFVFSRKNRLLIAYPRNTSK